MAAKRTLWSSLAIMAMLMELAMAANYTVGAPNGGWDTSTNLQTWASSQSFLVGDNLSKYNCLFIIINKELLLRIISNLILIKFFDVY